jgi:hypothetical protein
MAETLGSLCDKLTIVKLKQWHTEDAGRVKNLQHQEISLVAEINQLFTDAISGVIPESRLIFLSNKVYKKEGNELSFIAGSLGTLVSDLAMINSKLWHEQEKVYDFSAVPAAQKDVVVKNLAIFNLERNKCIESIDTVLHDAIVNAVPK